MDSSDDCFEDVDEPLYGYVVNLQLKQEEPCDLRQGPLNIWTEHSNCQIHSRGDSKTLIALLLPNIFLGFFMKLFFYANKS